VDKNATLKVILERPMPKVGELIDGKYRLEGKIGEGGMATVWRAVQLPLDRPVAVKFLHAVEGPRSEAIMQRFLREAKALAAVQHPNIVQILDFGSTVEKQPFMVMELLEGISLCEHLARTSVISLRELEDIMLPVISGLTAVHDAGIAHRDIKPENIFLNKSGGTMVPKLLDFGVARAVEKAQTGLASAIPTVQGLIVGTPQYMSAEQARGLPDIDKRTDIYSLGVILYESLTGRMPFDAAHFGDLIVMITGGRKVPFHALRPDLGMAFSELVEKAMARDRDVRFPNINEFSKAFREALLDASTRVDPSLMIKPDAVPDGPATPVYLPQAEIQHLQTEIAYSGETFIRKQRRRGVWGWLIAVVILVGLLGMLAFVSFTRTTNSTNKTVATETVGESTVRLSGVPSSARILLDGKVVSSPSITLPKRNQTYTIRVETPGFSDWEVRHNANADGNYEVGISAVSAQQPALTVEPAAPQTSAAPATSASEDNPALQSDETPEAPVQDVPAAEADAETERAQIPREDKPVVRPKPKAAPKPKVVTSAKPKKRATSVKSPAKAKPTREPSKAPPKRKTIFGALDKIDGLPPSTTSLTALDQVFSTTTVLDKNNTLRRPLLTTGKYSS